MQELGREAIVAAMAANRCKFEAVDVPRWGGAVLVWEPTAGERDEFEAGLIGQDGKADVRESRAKLCALCLRDCNGQKLFSPAELSAVPAAILDPIFAVCKRLAGMTDLDEVELGIQKKDSKPPADN